MQAIRLRATPIVVLLALGLLTTACGPSVERLTRTGNEAFAKSAYEEALEAYQSAQVQSPELAEPYYNAANALYRQGQYAQALAQLETAVMLAETTQEAEGQSSGKSGPLAQHARFNQGNASFNSQDWEAAIAAYKEALLRDPYDQDAKVNLELALRQLEEQPQNEQEQPQEEQEQQPKESEEQRSEQQQEQASEAEPESGGSDESDGAEGQKDQKQESPRPNETNQAEEQQNNDSSQTEEGSDSDRQQQNGSDQPQAGRERQGTQQPNQGQPGQQSPDHGQQRPQTAAWTPAPGQRMSTEQARQLLAAIARNGETLQERLGQYLLVRGRPPVQDW